MTTSKPNAETPPEARALYARDLRNGDRITNLVDAIATPRLKITFRTPLVARRIDADRVELLAEDRFGLTPVATVAILDPKTAGAEACE